MWPLLIIDTKRKERLQKQSELRTLFTSVADEGQRTLNCERCMLYMAEDIDKDDTTVFTLAKKWAISK